MTEEEYAQYISDIDSHAAAAFALNENLETLNTEQIPSLDHDFDENIPQPHPSWILKDNGVGGKYWDAPIDMPLDGKIYFWNEELLSWIEAI